MIVRRTLQHNVVVPGGGAIDMELSRLLRQHAKTIHGKSQFFVNAYAKALEVIPRQLSQNAGFDATELLNKLRHAHAKGDMNMGIDIEHDGICNTWDRYIWEPALVKKNAITAATEAACLILTIDETVKNPKSENEKPGAPGVGGPGRGRGGRGMRR